MNSLVKAFESSNIIQSYLIIFILKILSNQLFFNTNFVENIAPYKEIAIITKLRRSLKLIYLFKVNCDWGILGGFSEPLIDSE